MRRRTLRMGTAPTAAARRSRAAGWPARPIAIGLPSTSGDPATGSPVRSRAVPVVPGVVVPNHPGADR